MLATVCSAALLGVEGRPVTVEVHVTSGFPGFTIVGLPDASCREARDRVRAAIVSSGLTWPQKRVTVNLAPSGMRKGGAGLDLPIAVALLVADGQLDAAEVEGLGLLGELGLDGSLRAVTGVVPLVAAIAALAVVVPHSCIDEARVLERHLVRSVPSLRTLVSVLRGFEGWPLLPLPRAPQTTPAEHPDLVDVRGQHLGRFAVEVAAAGGHHILLTGPPGAGKTMLARRLPGLLPPLDFDEAVEVTRIHSAAGLSLPEGALLRRPPFRAPHHGSSAVSLIGGGTTWMRPGEISCAHHGVLFLDELAEFPSVVLDMLRQPLEEGSVMVCRARAAVRLPAQFLLVAAANPCPCGSDGSVGSCRCSDAARVRYAARISGPLLDRFDLRVPVNRPEVSDLLAPHGSTLPLSEASAPVSERVAKVRQISRQRGTTTNAAIAADRLDELVPLENAARALLEQRLCAGQLSARGLHRIRRVARTIADLSGRMGTITRADIALALDLRTDPFAARMIS